MRIEGVNSSLITAAHELKTPLVLLRQLTLELENTTDETRRLEITKRIKLTAERSLRLTDNLTKMARLDDALFEMEPIQLPNLCYEVIEELIPLSDCLNQKIKLKHSGKATVVVGHRELTRSLLMGLIDNALQYNPGGKSISIFTQLCGHEAVIAVRDFGPTVSLDQYRKLAESLGDQAMPISARPLSSGLGLMIAGKFAGAMNGRLSVNRHHSGGMTFKVHLPISRQLNLLEPA